MSNDDTITSDITSGRYQQKQHGPDTTQHDYNSSIIGIVRSRVSNILPQTLYKWFSPVTDDNCSDILRRYRGERQYSNVRRNTASKINNNDGENNERTGYRGDGDNDDGIVDEVEILMPPLKRTKLNITEERSTNSSRITSIKKRNSLSTSTPTNAFLNRRRSLNLMKKRKDSPYMFQNASKSKQSLSYQIPSNIDTEVPDYVNEDVPSADTLEMVAESNEVSWNCSNQIISKQNLRTTSSVCHHNSLNTFPKERTNCLNVIKEIEGDSDEMIRNRKRENIKIGEGNGGGSNAVVTTNTRKNEELVLTNGKVCSNTMQVEQEGNTTESESGKSRYSNKMSSVTKSSELFSTDFSNIVSKISTPQIANSNIGLNFYTHLGGKKSLFSHKNVNLKSVLTNSTTSLTSLTRKSFNASLYGSMSALSDSRLLNIKSPFYKGRTTYGGASAYGKSTSSSVLTGFGQSGLMKFYHTSCTSTSIRPSSSLSSLSSSTSLLQATSTNDVSPQPQISCAAKRILQLIDQFTTPLTDAKKMASTVNLPSSLIDHKKRFNDDLKQSRVIRMNVPATPYSRPHISKLIITTKNNLVLPPKNELQVPSMAILLQMKRLQSNIEKVREIANASKSNLNTLEEYQLPSVVTNTNIKLQNLLESTNNKSNMGNSKHITKIRNKTTKNVNENEISSSVNLPEVALPFMKSVPKIDITIPKMSLSLSRKQHQLVPKTESKLFTETNTKSVAIKKFEIPSKSNVAVAYTNAKLPLSEINNLKFEFSMPLSIKSNSKQDPIPIFEPLLVDKFDFSKPMTVKVNNSHSAISSKNYKFQTLTSSKVRDNSQKFGTVTAITNSLPSIPLQLRSGSVLDLLEKQSGCSLSLGTSLNQSESTGGFEDQFKLCKNQWGCSVCMIQIENSNNKCSACEGLKIKSNTATSTSTCTLSSSSSASTSTVTNSFIDLFKPNPNSWECPDCMIINNNKLCKCIACSASKPGDKLLFPVSSSVVPNIAKVTTTQDTHFKNLVAQQSSKWECLVCMTRNDQNCSKCACCEQEKPVSKYTSNFQRVGKSSKFTFGFSATQKEDHLKKHNCKKTSSAVVTVTTVTSSCNESATKNKKESDSRSKGGFSFGVISSSGMVSSSTLNTTSGYTARNQTQQKASHNSKDLPDVSTSSNFKFDIKSDPQTNNKFTNETFLNVQLNTVKTFPLGANKQNIETGITEAQFKFDFAGSMTPISINNKQDQKTNEKTPETSNPTFSENDNDPENNLNSSFITQKPDSTADSSNSLNICECSTNKKSINNIENSNNKILIFNSGGAIITEPSKVPPIFSSGFNLSCTQKSATDNSQSQVVTLLPSTITTTVETPFPLISSNANSSIVATNANDSTFKSLISTAVTSSSLIFGSNMEQPNLTFDSILALSQQQGQQSAISRDSKFDSSFNSASSNNTLMHSSGHQSSTLFAFGSTVTKTKSISEPIFGSVSSTTNKRFVFGSNQTVTTTASSSDGFGVVYVPQKNSECTSVFGSSIGSSTPTFLRSTTAPYYTQHQQTSEAKSDFGQQLSCFGNSTTSVPSSSKPIFGSNASNSTSLFSSTVSIFNNTFGDTNLTSGSTFVNNNDCSLMRKAESALGFNVSVAPQSASTGIFTFGASNNSQQQPFNFSASTTPTFNFTGTQETTSQPFQFGYVPMKPFLNLSGIGTPSNAPFQFSAAGVHPVINIFAPTQGSSTSSQQAVRRKIRPRRTQPR